MKNMNDHPTVKRFYQNVAHDEMSKRKSILSASQLREQFIEHGADDVGFVDISAPAIADQKAEILGAFPWAKTLVSIVGRMNKENLRNPARSISSVELQMVEKRLNHAAHVFAASLDKQGIRAAAPVAGFPMETDNWPGKMQVISHKPIAEAAGLGKMGLHRNVIHPVYGSFVLLNTVIIDAEVDKYSQSLDYNPCLNCKICSTACPTGAIDPSGAFNAINCLTHTYRELMGGFADWTESIANSKNAIEYRSKVSDSETISRWQSLAYGPCYKSVYCMAVCPAGDDVIPQFLSNKKTFLDEVVKPLQAKSEIIYVLPGSDAEDHVNRRFPHKNIKRVGNGIRPPTVAAFIRSMPMAFQRNKSEGLSATYHFTFTGKEQLEATVSITNKTINVSKGHVGVSNVSITSDSETWLRVLRKETSIVKEIVFRRVRVKGSMKLFKDFGRCFA